MSNFIMKKGEIHTTVHAAVQPGQFGKDHWSTFAYIETLCVDFKGVPDLRRMRCDIDRHPGLRSNSIGSTTSTQKYPTRLAGGIDKHDHDDWDCADDLEAAGLIHQNGTGINPVFQLTPEGVQVASALRAHKAAGGVFSTFKM